MRLSRNSGKIFWGLLLILAAAYMIVGKMGILPDISIFTILLTVFLVWVMLKGIRKVSFSEILFPLAFLKADKNKIVPYKNRAFYKHTVGCEKL